MTAAAAAAADATTSIPPSEPLLSPAAPPPPPPARSPLRLVLTASLSGLLFGYDTGIISSTLLHLPLSFPVSTVQKSLITSAPSLLALLASPLTAPLADTLGRRALIGWSCLLFALGAGTQALAPSAWVMVAGRGVVGVAIGVASGLVPLYIAEVAGAERRGALVTVQSLAVTGGQVLAYLLGWACGPRWRWAVGAGAVPAALQAVLLVRVLEESPRWLVLKGREAEARVVLERLGLGEGEGQVARIRGEVGLEERGWRDGLRELWGRRGNRRALGIACMLQGLQQLCGFNVLMYFSATIFSLVGFSSPVMTSLSIAVTNFLFTLVAFSLIDSIGRRRILLISIPFMFFGLGLCALCFTYLPIGHSLGLADYAKRLHSAAVDPQVTPTRSHGGSSTLPFALLISLVLYVAAYALGLGCVPWQQGELFPLPVRSLGSGIATATNWSSNFIVGMTFLPMMELVGSSVTFSLYAMVCFAGWFLVYFFYPETAGLELEDVSRLLADGWGVKAGQAGRRGQGHVIVPQDDPDEQ